MKPVVRAFLAVLALGIPLTAGAQQPAPAPPAAPQPAAPAAPRPAVPRRPATTTRPAPAGPASMTNQDVLRLVAVGLPEDAVISVIRQAPRSSFTLTPAGLAALKRGKVTDGIIAAMQAPAGDAKPATASVPPPPQPATPPPPVMVTLKKGTTVNVQLKNLLASDKARTGALLEFEVVDDVLVDGRVMIKKGSAAMGRITQAAARRRSNPGKIEFNIDTVKASNGTDIRLIGTQGAEGVRGAEVSFPAASKFIAVTDEDFVMRLPPP